MAMPRPSGQPRPGGQPAGDFNANRLAQLQQSGYTGTYMDAAGNRQQMTNGVLAQPNMAKPAAAPLGNSFSGNSGNSTAPTLGQSGGPLGQWAPWMTSGGVNAQGWQSLGGAPNTNFLQMGNWTQGGADPANVNTGGNPFEGVQQYTDQAYGEATRQLDPQWQQNQAAFDQQMVNRGIAPGSAAYDQAKQDFDRSRTDAYSQARGQAMQQGLGAQNQMFQQGLAESGLSNQLAQALIGANSSFANQQLGGNASIMNQLLGGNSGIAQQLIGGQATTNAARASAAASRANGMNQYNLGMANLQQQGQQQDFGNLMQLLAMGQGVTSYNNGQLGADQQRNQSLFGFLPGGAGGSIDVTSPYNNQYNGQMNAYNIGQQNQNAQNQAYMNALSAILCDRDAKEGCVEFTGSCLDIVRALPVDHWNYKGQAERHIGTYAQDFNKAAGLPDKPYIHIIDMLGVLLGAVKEIGVRLDRTDQTIEALARAA